MILLLALVIRLNYFVGFVGGHPQDDGIYRNLAISVSQGNLHFNPYYYRTISRDYIANPAETFQFRVAFVYPLAFFFYLLGISDFSAGLFPLLCSLASIIVVYSIARLIFDKKVAFLSAFLLAIFPFDILHSTRILPDIPFALFTGLAFLMYLLSREKSNPIYLALSGLALGIAYLTKTAALAVFLLLFIFVLFDSIRKKKPLILLYYFVGFLSVILVEGSYYLWKTGIFFLDYKIAKSSVIYKYTKEGVLSQQLLPFFNYACADAFYFLYKLLLNINAFSWYKLSGFGIYYYFAILGVIAVFFKRKVRAFVLFFWLLVLYLYLEFGPLDIQIQNGIIIYRGVYKHLRYLTLLTIPAIPFAGYFVSLVLKKSRVLGVALMALLVVSSYFYLKHDYDILRGSQNDLREAIRYLKDKDKIICSDYFAISDMRYYLGEKGKLFHFENINKFPDPRKISHAYIILGGGRGIEIVSEAVMKVIPIWAQKYTENPSEAPVGWEVIRVIGAEKNGCRKYDMIIYSVDEEK